MKKLDIPLFQQEIGSLDCGPTCTQMILSYYGIERSLADLQKNLTYDEMGTTIYDNGILMLTEGLKTLAITAQPLLFSPDTTPLLKNEKDIIRLLEGKGQEDLESMNKNKWIIKSMKNYLTRGGKLQIKIPVFEHLKNAIDNNSPVLVLLYAKSLGSNEGGFHFVVVSGYKRGQVYVNNPLPGSIKQGWYPIQEFLYGVYASTCVNFDNGTFLVVSR